MPLKKLPKLGPGNNDAFAEPLGKFLHAFERPKSVSTLHTDADVLNVSTVSQSAIIVDAKS